MLCTNSPTILLVPTRLDQTPWPISDACAHWFGCTKVLTYVLGFFSLAGTLGAVLASMWFGYEVAIWLWFAAIAGWVIVRI
ncbi:MAG: hypothetical protein A2289_02810 [Deltaproteobacteria bacterium RIFOXYA12_FULL_58_15]|nr:MAG: hypothetical protein A2289_02810 [Deltaproteobacteria bacterium RIFOXYA12_FULL_58_15]